MIFDTPGLISEIVVAMNEVPHPDYLPNIYCLPLLEYMCRWHNLQSQRSIFNLSFKLSQRVKLWPEEQESLTKY